MDQQETAETLSAEDIDREQNRRMIELNLLESLKELFIEGDDETTSEYQKGFLGYLSQITQSWRVGRGSGTVGELITRWVGRGFLVDFPEFQEFSSGKEWSNVKIESADGGKSEIRAVATYREGSKQYTATYRFRVSKEDLDRRREHTLAELDEYSKLRYRDALND